MKNKGLVKFFAIALVVVTLFQLSFSWVSFRVEKKAKAYANGDKQQEKAYLDSVAGEVVYNLGVKKWTYMQCKEMRLNLGLDLQGGMNVTLEVSTPDIVRALSNYNPDPQFNQAVDEAVKMQANSQKDFVDLFYDAYKKAAPNNSLAPLFATLENKSKIKNTASDQEVLQFIKEEAASAFDRSFKILRTRIDQFGVTQPVIQKLQNGRILVELPGVDDPERVRKLLQGSAKLEFWQVYDNYEAYKYLEAINKALAARQVALNVDSATAGSDTAAKSEVSALDALAGTSEGTDSAKAAAGTDTGNVIAKADTGKAAGDTGKNKTPEQVAKENPLFVLLGLATNEDNSLAQGPVIGYAQKKDMAKIDAYLALPDVKAVLPPNLRFAWSNKPSEGNKTIYLLYALKAGADGRAALDGDVITDARPDVSPNGQREVSMTMNPEGAQTWKRLTKEASEAKPKKSIAIVLDGQVYSAPVVQGEIPGGQSSISGVSDEESKDLANVLKAGKMPAPARIVEEAIVGPSLGKEAINQGLISILIGFLSVIVFMYLVYNRAGWVADLAVLANLFFLIGMLSSLQAALTLPGIAGMILSLGMAVDANVLVNERVKEELAAGSGLRMAIERGYKNAFSAIIDSNVTTLLAGFVLLLFGTGPTYGFAVTLIIGIICSLFTAVLLTRLFFTWQLDRGKEISFSHNYSRTFLKGRHIDFIGKRKIYYIVSIVIILAGGISAATRGFTLGVDFKGGWNYIIEFNDNIQTSQIRSALDAPLGGAPEVKTFGSANKASITTSYNIGDASDSASRKVVSTITDGLTKAGYKDFKFVSEKKVGPTIADDIQKNALWAVLVAMVGMFIYILIRFQRIQFALGAVISLLHDVLIVLTLFTLLKDIMPFSLDIDQNFIAAILTVIGYSINDSVVVFDRVREFLADSKGRDEGTVINDALNDTLSRTLITGVSTICVLIILFIFGGQALKSFSFAMLVGVLIGTYSSLCIGTPIVLDFARKKKNQ